MSKRESIRYLEKGIPEEFYTELEQVISFAPSSCDRKGVEIEWVTDRKQKEILSGMMVGGLGWMHRADRLGLLWARKLAYKSPNDLPNMYLDAGILANQVYLYATANKVGCCFVNPNCNDIDYVRKMFNTQDILCGTLVIGKEVV